VIRNEACQSVNSKWHCGNCRGQRNGPFKRLALLHHVNHAVSSLLAGRAFLAFTEPDHDVSARNSDSDLTDHRKPSPEDRCRGFGPDGSSSGLSETMVGGHRQAFRDGEKQTKIVETVRH
jgi:hypothetical protein